MKYYYSNSVWYDEFNYYLFLSLPCKQKGFLTFSINCIRQTKSEHYYGLSQSNVIYNELITKAF